MIPLMKNTFLNEYETKKELVELALREFVENRSRMDLRQLKGAVVFDAGYEYRKSRRGR